jgi:polysaccharide biosynthesis/export protein
MKMTSRNLLRALSLIAVGSSSGCFLAPSMQMDESAAVKRANQHQRKGYRIEPITEELIARLGVDAPPVPKASDPLAAQAYGYEYQIAPYDVLSVTVWDHPELTTPSGSFRSPEETGNRVNARGDIYYPHVGLVHVAGKTVDEIRTILTTQLNRILQNPQLDVRVAAFRGRRAQVTGEVVTPTTIPITDVPLRVQDAIADAKGFAPEADWSNVTLSRDNKVYHLNLQALYEQGDMSQNWLLTDGDVVHVGDRSRNKVFVLGEVRLPQSRQMVNGRMTLAEALNETGGMESAISNVSKIYVIRGNYDVPDIYHLDASSADAMLLATQFQLRPRDVVFVSTYGLSQWNNVFLQILPTVTGLWDAYDLSTRATLSVTTGTLH